MKTLPRTIHNPLVKDSVTFVKSSEDTNGEYTLAEVTLQPGGNVGMHYHTDFTEHFEVIKGRLGLAHDKKEFYLQPGEKYLIPKKAMHRFFNDSSEPVVFHCMVTPARGFEKVLRIAYGLAVDNKVHPKSGIPKNFWHAVLLFQIGETYLPGPPRWFQKGSVSFLAALARMVKADKKLKKYYTPQDN